jgi:hypothetical protein
MFSWKHTERSAFTQTAQLLRFPFSKVNLVVLPNKRDSSQVHMRGDPAWYFPAAPLSSTTVRRPGYAGHLRVSRDAHNCRTQIVRRLNGERGYRCPISTRPVSPARSPLFGSGSSPSWPGSMRVRTDPTRISGSGSDKKLGMVG